jgi:hypothetical protein
MPAPTAYKWAISFGKEATFGVAETVAGLTNWFPVKSADLTDIQTSWETDADEITGYRGETFHQVFERKGTVSRTAKASLELLTWCIEMMNGNHVDSGTTPNFISTVKWPTTCTMNPPSFSYLEAEDCPGATNTWFLYKGAVLESFSVDFNGKGPGTITMTIKTDGSELAQPSAVLPATAYAATRLFGYMVNTKLGPIGTEDITAIMRSWKMTVTMGSVEPPSMAAGVFVAEQQYGLKNPKIDVELVVKADKGHAIYGYYNPVDQTTSTTVKHIASIVVNTNRQIVLTNSQAKVVTQIKPSGSEFQGTVKVMEEHNATDLGPGVFVCKTGVTAWLAATP